MATGASNGSSWRSSGTLPAERFERLVSALRVLVGWEATIVLQDTRGLSTAEAEEVCVWAARALLAAETA